MTTDFFSDSDSADAVAVLPDGKIVAAGTTTSSGFGARRDIAIARYMPDGSLDTTFDFDGRALFRNFDIFSVMTPREMLINPDGGVWAVGDFRTNTPPTIMEMFAVHMRPDGKPDKFFAEDGFFLSIVGSASAMTAAFQGDGKLVLVGTVGDVSGINGLTLLRLDRAGNLDAGFGTGGILQPEIEIPREEKLKPEVALIQADGKILVAGHTGVQFSPGIDVITIARFNPDGEPDPGFGTIGRVLTPLGPEGKNDQVKGLAIQPDGKILVVGSDGKDAALLRFTSDGRLDETFGDGGVVIQNFDGIFASGQGVALQPDCKIVVAGFVATSLLSGHSFLARYLRDGTLDERFGDEGLATLQEFVFGLALQEDGKIIVAGTTAIPPTRDFFVARYEGKADTPEGLLVDLLGQVECFALPSGLEQGLLAKLKNAQSDLVEGDIPGTCRYLHAFERHLEAQAGKRSLTEVEAGRLFAVLEEIAQELGCLR